MKVPHDLQKIQGKEWEAMSHTGMTWKEYQEFQKLPFREQVYKIISSQKDK